MRDLEVGLGVADLRLELVVLVHFELERLRKAAVKALPAPDPEGRKGLVQEPAF